MKAQSRAPLAVAAATFASGLFIAGHLHRAPALWGWSTAALAICALSAVAIKSLRPAQTAAILAMICVGAFTRVATPIPSVVMPPQEMLSGDQVEIVAHVTNDGALLAGGGPRERF